MRITDRQFAESSRIGKLGEAQFYERHAYTPWLLCEDVSDNLEYRSKDIDFLVENLVTGKKTTVEIKTDTRATQTGNLFIEEWTNKECAVPGYLYKSQADIIVFYFVNGLRKHTHNAIYVSLPALRAFVEANKDNSRILKRREVNGGYDPYNKKKTVTGWTMPVTVLLSHPELIITREEWDVEQETNNWMAA